MPNEQIIQILVQSWGLPEDQVRAFIASLLRDVEHDAPGSIEHLREASSALIQDYILSQSAEKS